MSKDKALKGKNKKVRKKKVMIVIGAILLSITLVFVGFIIYGNHQMNKIPTLSASEVIEYTTKDNPDAIITVGIIKDGQISYKVYGENGQELPPELHTYEIGSLTKTFTAALVEKAVMEGKINIEDTIDHYLSLPSDKTYPTIKELLTHTSGYKAHYFESPMIGNFFGRRNDFYGISKDRILRKAKEIKHKKDSYDFRYSNYGYAVLGLVLEAVYDTDYTTLANNFSQNELSLSDTIISNKSGDLGNYWDWKEDDGYISAGAITSNIKDMLSYAQMQLDSTSYFNECHKSLEEINASSKKYKTMDINMDEIGMAWLIDKENNIVWHNGGTDDYNSYLGFCPETKTAVVVLSNLSPNYRIPATVLGVKILKEINKK